jgi:hypothetical protein
MTQTLRSGPNGIALKFSANAVDDNAAEKAINAEMILSVVVIDRVPACGSFGNCRERSLSVEVQQGS